MDPAWVAAITGLTVAVATALAWTGRHAWRFLSRMVRFLDDYFGTPAHDGLPEKPGVMARLGSVEKLVDQVLAETQPNSGQSLRDVVSRTAADVVTVKTDQAAMRGRMDALELTVRGGKP